ncbi:MAG: sensor histidine kinase [Prosthecobacter sp.]|uniref:sensor histidine kinase n=1 Tax=Prosthecobacter sp. TaxID=1965333 RepID=UPI00390418D2
MPPLTNQAKRHTRFAALPPAYMAGGTLVVSLLATLALWLLNRSDERWLLDTRFSSQVNRAHDAVLRESQRLDQAVRFSRILLEKSPDNSRHLVETLNEFRRSTPAGSVASLGWLDVLSETNAAGAPQLRLVNSSVPELGFGETPTINALTLPGVSAALQRTLREGVITSVRNLRPLPNSPGPTRFLFSLPESNNAASWPQGSAWPHNGHRLFTAIIHEERFWQGVRDAAAPVQVRITPLDEDVPLPPQESLYEPLEIQGAGLRWRFTVTPLPTFFDEDIKTSGITLITGGIISSLLSLLVLAQARARVTAEQAQADIMLANASLEQRIRERTQELRDALTTLTALEQQLRTALDHERELNSLKSSFVNMISHEFRTPLGMILFSASMLESLEQEMQPAERAEQLRAISDAVGRMNDLVEQALSLGRAETASPRPAALDAEMFCRRIIHEVLSATAHRCTISLHNIADATQGTSDELMLRTVLTNLLGNAVKYSPAGSHVTLQLSRDGSSIIFTVSDEGPGIHPDDLPRLFTSFHRGAGTEGIPGTGLGLAIVKRCADALGGTITVNNLPQGGAAFVCRIPFYLPLTTPCSPPSS